MRLPLTKKRLSLKVTLEKIIRTGRTREIVGVTIAGEVLIDTAGEVLIDMSEVAIGEGRVAEKKQRPSSPIACSQKVTG